ncbi:MAG TPA: DUF6484 domain-containing protein [Myxococcaceae bacterium]|nr:DUF6484 domain-containing protein [Myxococcaceae bacterium]
MSPPPPRRAAAPAATELLERASHPITGVRVGWIAGFDVQRGLLVDFPGSGGPVPARSIVPLDKAAVERAAAEKQGAVLQFENGDPRLPVLMGLIQPAVQTPLLDALLAAPAPGTRLEAKVDGRRVTIEGKDEIVLRCGQASITLRRDGKVVLRGTYLETRATGTNRIKGGSVQIN